MWNAKIAARKETGKWRTPNPVPGREGGGEALQTRSGNPGRRKRSAAHTDRSLGPRPSRRTDGGLTPRRFRDPAASPRRAPIPHPGSGKWRRAAKGGEGVRTIGPPPTTHPPSPQGQPPLEQPLSLRSLARPPAEADGRLPLRRLRPRHALSKNSLISNPLPPSRTQSLQPDSPQPSETKKISADAHAPDSS